MVSVRQPAPATGVVLVAAAVDDVAALAEVTSFDAEADADADGESEAEGKAVERCAVTPDDALALADAVAPALARFAVPPPWPEYARATTPPITSRRQTPSTPLISPLRRPRPRLPPLMGSPRT
jgi:hypothetical protein